jgi:hypothetical protein
VSAQDIVGVEGKGGGSELKYAHVATNKPFAMDDL